jgi:hypothetical protein
MILGLLGLTQICWVSDKASTPSMLGQARPTNNSHQYKSFNITIREWLIYLIDQSICIALDIG